MDSTCPKHPHLTLYKITSTAEGEDLGWDRQSARWGIREIPELSLYQGRNWGHASRWSSYGPNTWKIDLGRRPEPRNYLGRSICSIIGREPHRTRKAALEAIQGAILLLETRDEGIFDRHNKFPKRSKKT